MLLWGQLMAAALIAMLPVVLLFMLVQRFEVQGLTVGAVKAHFHQAVANLRRRMIG